MPADRPGTLFADQPERLRAQTAWVLLGPGTPFIYYGNEIGQPQGPQRGDTRHRQPLDWEELDRQRSDPDSIWHWHQRLIGLRHEHASLRRGKARFLATNVSTADVLAMWREADGDATLTILSGSSATVDDLVVTFSLDVDPQGSQSTIAGDADPTVDGHTLELGRLGPFGVKLFWWRKP